MAKKTKSKGMKIPKKVAGFKVPKPVRKNLDSLIGLLGTPEGKAMMGSVVAAVAGAVASRRGRPARPPGSAGK